MGLSLRALARQHLPARHAAVRAIAEEGEEEAHRR